MPGYVWECSASADENGAIPSGQTCTRQCAGLGYTTSGVSSVLCQGGEWVTQSEGDLTCVPRMCSEGFALSRERFLSFRYLFFFLFSFQALSV